MVTIDYNDFTKKGLKSLLQKFETAGLPVKEVTADNKQKREAGYPIKQAMLVFESGQTLVLKVKASGDLYQAKLNGKVLAIKEYHKAETFSNEVMAYVKANEAAYTKNKEKQLSKTRVVVPKIKPVNTSIAEQVATFSASLEEFKGTNEAIKTQLATLQPQVAEKDTALLRLQAQIEEENNRSTTLQQQLDALKSGMVMEAAGTAPVQIDRVRIAQDILHGNGRHPQLTAAFIEGFNNSCSIDDAILFVNSFSDAELLQLLKEEENIFEGVELRVDGKIARLPKDYFLKWISAPEDTPILEAVAGFNAFQEANGQPARVMIFECSDCELENPGDTIALTPVSPVSDGEMLAVNAGTGTYAINSAETGLGAFQDTTVLMPYTYPAPVVATSASRGDCPKCGGDMEPYGTGKMCQSCGYTEGMDSLIVESGTEVTLKGHRTEGDELAGKKAIILESVPTAHGPFYKVNVGGLIYRGVPSGMILEAVINLDIDRSGTHDINDPQHVDDPDHENYGGKAQPCPWCGSDVRENRCIQCNRQLDMAIKDREAWVAANKPLPADDFPSQYE